MQIKKFARTSHKVKALIYGASGTGKTSFGGTCPKPIFASAEGGLLSIADKNPDYVDIKTERDLTDLLAFLRAGDHPYETVVIDSISEISQVIIDGLRKAGKQLTLQDYGTLSDRMRNLLRDFRNLPMHVVVLALEKIEKDEDRVVSRLPELAGKTASSVGQFMDVVGYSMVDKEGNHKIFTTPHNTLITKNRGGSIPSDCLDFSRWIEILSEEKIQAQEVVVSETPSLSTEVLHMAEALEILTTDPEKKAAFLENMATFITAIFGECDMQEGDTLKTLIERNCLDKSDEDLETLLFNLTAKVGQKQERV